jgi:hypothetical protein
MAAAPLYLVGFSPPEDFYGNIPVRRDDRFAYNACIGDTWQSTYRSTTPSIKPTRGGLSGEYTETDPAPLWKTGQTEIFRPGDDGETQTGTEWPSPRFFLNLDNATVIDPLTGLTWTRGAETPIVGNCFGGL